jgi:hypothetical protein
MPVRLTVEARDALNRLAFRLTGDTMSRVELSDALMAACKVAETDYDKTLHALTGNEETKDDQ